MGRRKKNGEETAPMGVRLTESQRAALQRIAASNDCDASDLIRWAVKAFIAHVERHGGRILLPVDFSETFQVVQGGQEDHSTLRVAEGSEAYKPQKKEVGA